MKARDLFKNNKTINEWLEESMGEVTLEIEELLKSQEENIEDFIGYMFDIIKRDEAKVKGKKEYAKEILESAKIIENRINRNKTLVDTFMKIINKDKIETVAGTVSYIKSKAVLVDMKKLDKRYIIVKTTEQADKKALKKALKKGLVTGASLEERKNLQMKG